MTRVLRADRRAPPRLDASAVDASARAQAILTRAEERAAQCIARAEREAERLRQAARRQGRAQGQAEAAACLARAAQCREQALREAEPELTALALRAARRIVEHELSIAPETVTQIVAGLLAQLRRARRVTVRAHPEDAQVLRRALPELLAAREAPTAIEIEADSGLTRGDCVVESDIGGFDARLDVRFEALASALKDA